jgi:hypothetical protein
LTVSFVTRCHPAETVQRLRAGYFSAFLRSFPLMAEETSTFRISESPWQQIMTSPSSLEISVISSLVCEILAISSSVFHWKCSSTSAGSMVIETAKLRGESNFRQSLSSLNFVTILLSSCTVVSPSAEGNALQA